MKKLISSLCIALLSLPAAATEQWKDIELKARGQTVFFHAWGGSQQINNYLRW